MRVLILSNYFPPYALGGAEMAASSLAAWLARRGDEVCVLTSAPLREQEGSERDANGVRIERRYFPNLYFGNNSQARPGWQKTLWHLRDHFNPASEAICREVFDDFAPELVNTHDLQGIGYNVLREIGRQQLPCVQVLHDFGFLCVNMRMFKNGSTCRYHHLPCAASSWLKRSYFQTIPRLAFWSPSEALLARYRPHLVAHHREAVCIPLPLSFSQPLERNAADEAQRSRRVRLLFVGQLLPTKGIDFVLEILRGLAAELSGRFEITVVGGGELLEPLRREHQSATWVTFTGRLPPEAVGGVMSKADLLLIPSVWFENSPVVAYQAIQLGLPILASDIGGVPELVRHGVNGELLPPGDAPAWAAKLRVILSAPERLHAFRAGAQGLSRSFDPEILGEKVVKLFERTITGETAKVSGQAAVASTLPS